MELPPQTQAILIGVIIVLAISHELHNMQVNSAYMESLAKLSKGLESTPLPKKFALKLTAEIETTPAEFADALADEVQRFQWELRLTEIKKRDQGKLSLQYIGSTTSHEVGYDFEVLGQTKPSSELTSFMVHEETVLN